VVTLNMFFIKNNFPAYEDYLILYQMSNAFVIIKMCYVYNQWYNILCATLYYHSVHSDVGSNNIC
jgi:hypothetical protein